ncbi:Uncharacterized protein PBTT_08079 [Plasmodiophora brassicae]|uniref:Uncharacterized protein n=1 Tax=Plasmodiophora brassicae TaxID=37360 RepID=A0A3P3YJT9_PLABS|nr:unnamed protein product [Plasmodiophora brassicae]
MQATVWCWVLAIGLATAASARSIGPDGIERMYDSIAASDDWSSSASWQDRRVLHRYRPDPHDSRAVFHGIGHAAIANGTMTLNGSPRIYVASKEDHPWENVEITLYVRNGSGNATGPASVQSLLSGLSIVTRTNDKPSLQEPCNSYGYLMRYWLKTGDVGVQKQFWRDRTTGKTIYTLSSRNPIPIDARLLQDRFLGLKFIVQTLPDHETVHVRVYVDFTGGRDGGQWRLWQELLDVNWAAYPDSYDDLDAFPCTYDYTPHGREHSSSPVLARGSVTVIRADNVTDLQIKSVSIRNIAPASISGATAGDLLLQDTLFSIADLHSAVNPPIADLMGTSSSPDDRAARPVEVIVKQTTQHAKLVFHPDGGDKKRPQASSQRHQNPVHDKGTVMVTGKKDESSPSGKTQGPAVKNDQPRKQGRPTNVPNQARTDAKTNTKQTAATSKEGKPASTVHTSTGLY